MMKKLLAGIFLLTHILAYGQYMPLNFGARISVTSVTPTAPHTYRISGLVQDNLSKWNASDVQASQDSVYHLGGSNLYNYRISSIQSAAGNSITMTLVDEDSTGDYPSTGTEWAVVKFTTANKFPYWLSGVSDNLNSAIQNRFVQRLDVITADKALTETYFTLHSVAADDVIPAAGTYLKRDAIVIPFSLDNWYVTEITVAAFVKGGTGADVKIRLVKEDGGGGNLIESSNVNLNNTNYAASLNIANFQVNEGDVLYAKVQTNTGGTSPVGCVVAIKLKKTI